MFRFFSEMLSPGRRDAPYPHIGSIKRVYIYILVYHNINVDPMGTYMSLQETTCKWSF